LTFEEWVVLAIALDEAVDEQKRSSRRR